MKRRNFFSKIAKGLLGIGIVTALPTPEVETSPEIAPDTSLDLSLSEHTPVGFTIIDNQYYIVEPTKNTAKTYDINDNPFVLDDLIVPTKND